MFLKVAAVTLPSEFSLKSKNKEKEPEISVTARKDIFFAEKEKFTENEEKMDFSGFIFCSLE